MTTFDTEKSAEPDADSYEVVVVGGGASGLAAGLFTARYGLDTLVLDRGASAIRRCYNVENFLGLLGIRPRQFLELARAHAQYEGCEVVDQQVTGVTRSGEEFAVRTDAGRELRAGRVVAATAYDADYLTDLADGEFHDEDDHPVAADEDGRTEVEGLYVAGWLSGGPHQVLVAAGHGARVAKSLVHDYRCAEEDYWEEVAKYWDWRVEDGTYGDDQWEEHVDEWFDERVPADADLDPERVAAVREAVKEERLAFQISAAEREERLDDARSLLEEVLWDEA